MSTQEVSAFLSDLATRVSASTQNQALATLLFLYAQMLHRPLESIGEVVHAKRPARLPVVMTSAEVDAVLCKLDGLWRLMASLLYGSGLRLLECAALRVKDVDFRGGQVLVRRGKGAKDRATLLPRSLVQPLQKQLVSVRELLRTAARSAGLEKLLDHHDVRTTMIYTHVVNRGPFGVKSPLDR
jgi:site-specific recombinase XerD